VLVAAVLRPEEREDGELEVVRLALEQLADTVELPVRETERPMERLFRDLRQAAIVPANPEGQARPSLSLRAWTGLRPVPMKRGKAVERWDVSLER
jgi:hypothetical protein